MGNEPGKMGTPKSSAQSQQSQQERALRAEFQAAVDSPLPEENGLPRIDRGVRSVDAVYRAARGRLAASARGGMPLLTLSELRSLQREYTDRYFKTAIRRVWADDDVADRLLRTNEVIRIPDEYTALYNRQRRFALQRLQSNSKVEEYAEQKDNAQIPRARVPPNPPLGLLTLHAPNGLASEDQWVQIIGRRISIEEMRAPFYTYLVINRRGQTRTIVEDGMRRFNYRVPSLNGWIQSLPGPRDHEAGTILRSQNGIYIGTVQRQIRNRDWEVMDQQSFYERFSC